MTRVGKSAGGEMHLAAAVYCEKCDMYVELGTEDCPHAIEMYRAIAEGRCDNEGKHENSHLEQ